MTDHVRAWRYLSVRADWTQHPVSQLACVADVFRRHERYPVIGPRRRGQRGGWG